MKRLLTRLAIAGLALGLSGCAAMVAGGAVTAMATAHDRRSTSEVWKDNRLELSIMDTINRDKELALQNHVAVVSHNRVVLVIGEVRTPELKERALGIVRSFDDVRRVVDELQVREPAPFGTGARDATVTARAKTALLDIVDLPGFDVTRVNVTTRDGVVYLMGLVTEEEGERVAATISQLSGVARVVKVFEYIEGA
jgi:osmotically-inducible protein OsmY